MKITLGDIVFGCGSDGGAGGGGGSVSSSHPLPNGIKFVGSTWETFDCGKYDWSQIYDASEMFSNCANLKRIDNFPKNEINGCVYMFDGCSALESVPNGINLKPYYTIDWMFNGCTNLTEIPYFDTSKVYSFQGAWANCDKLASFPMLDTSKVTDFGGAWNDCDALASFPLIDTSKGTNFSNTWRFCKSLTSFPQLDTSKGTNFSSAWQNCVSLTEFPALDLSKGTNFSNAWYWCSSLTTMPALDLSNGTDFYNAWFYCEKLTNLGGFGAISADFDLSTSTLLTVDSLMNIINQAATVTGKTMTLGSTNLAKLTDEQKAVATSKGWTLA